MCVCVFGFRSDKEEKEIPLPNVRTVVLKKVVEFLKHQAATPMKEIEKPLKSADMAEMVQAWFADFVDVEQELLFELILAANYLDIKSLLDLTCAKVASMIKGKTPEQIRKTFNITCEFPPLPLAVPPRNSFPRARPSLRRRCRRPVLAAARRNIRLSLIGVFFVTGM